MLMSFFALLLVFDVWIANFLWPLHDMYISGCPLVWKTWKCQRIWNIL